MSRFNLIDEKWIPVRMQDGTRDELGIKDTLLRAKEIAAIEDQSPLVVAALHRLLLAVLYRALEGPTDIKEAKALFNNGLPAIKIKRYLDKWRDRFYLLDKKYPFYQIPGFKPKEWKAWSKIAAEHNADNAKVLFDHMDVNNPAPISLSVSARLLIASQTFDLAVAKSEFVQPLDAPSARSIIFIVVGQSLHDTFCFGLKPQSKNVHENDSAIWEREPESVKVLKKGKAKIIAGYADLYTWRSRSIIIQETNDNKIVRLGFASGLKKDGESMFIDPMLGYHEVPELGLLPMKFHEEKEFWREFDSLLPGGGNQVPLILENAILLCKSAKDNWPEGVMVSGQKTKSGQAKIEFWRNTIYALPRALAGKTDARSFIHSILEQAEEIAEALRSSYWKYQRHLLIRGDRNQGKDIRKEEKIKIGEMVDSMEPLKWYWSTLGSCFHDILREYTLDRDLDDIRCQWLNYVRDAFSQAWEQHRASVSIGDAWAIRALAKAEGPVRKKLAELKEEILKYEPQKEAV